MQYVTMVPGEDVTDITPTEGKAFSKSKTDQGSTWINVEAKLYIYIYI